MNYNFVKEALHVQYMNKANNNTRTTHLIKIYVDHSLNLNHNITPRITLTTISLLRSEDIIIYDERKQILLKTQEQKLNLIVTIALL